jgi:hypothetical protein
MFQLLNLRHGDGVLAQRHHWLGQSTVERLDLAKAQGRNAGGKLGRCYSTRYVEIRHPFAWHLEKGNDNPRDTPVTFDVDAAMNS